MSGISSGGCGVFRGAVSGFCRALRSPAVIAYILIFVAAVAAPGSGTASGGEDLLSSINRSLKEHGIAGGYAVAGAAGAVLLKGEYEDEAQADRAFSLAQSVAGVSRVVPLEPGSVRIMGLEPVQKDATVVMRGTPGKEKRKAEVTPPGPVKDKYALVVGVSEFKNRIRPLQYAANDARNVYRYLTDPGKGDFPRENVIFLTNGDATKDNIVRALGMLKDRAGEDDLVIVYMSTHGTPPDKFGGVYLVTHESEVKPREKIWHTSLSEKILRGFIQDIRAKRLLILLDACYSNGAYEHISGFVPSGGKGLGISDDEVHGISAAYARRLLGAKDIVGGDSADEGNGPRVAAAPDSGWGMVLMGASGAGEKSWESVSLQSSIFTFYFLDGLNRFGGALRDAFEYARPLVARKVKEEKGQDIEQNSQVLASNAQWNFPIFGHNAPDVRKQEAFPGTAAAGEEKLDIRLWTDRQVYREGEKIRIFLSGSKPFYAKLLYKNAEGEILQLLPNAYRKDAFFWSGVVHEVPNEQDRFELEVGPPFGAEQISVYARQTLLGELNTESAGGALRVRSTEGEIPVLLRGIRIKEKRPEQAAPGEGDSESSGEGASDGSVRMQRTDSEFIMKTVSVETRKR